jgi:tryptophanase
MPQGRACEHLLFDALKTFKKNPSEEKWVISNGLFDTTKGNLFQTGFSFRDFSLPVRKGMPESLEILTNEFLGDIDISKAREFIIEKGGKENIFLLVLTITNNNIGGQPVSMKNIKECHALCKEFQIPLWFDGCRINENAFFIKKYEKGYES